MKPSKVLAILIIIAASVTLAVITRRDNSDVLKGNWACKEDSEVLTFDGSGVFTRTWTDSLGKHVESGHYRIENGADLFLSVEDEEGNLSSERYYFIIYHGDEMKLSARWYLKQK